MIRVADYIFQTLADRGIRHVFMVTGGGAMHLNDAIGRESRLHYVCNHHEQASAMAAESYARLCGVPAVVNVTSGPGGINALNGVFGAWTDSIPMIVISGQVKRETCMAFQEVHGLRQLGDQEADIISMVRGITKYAEIVREPNSIRFHLEKALHLATHGRPGPVWLDIPVDVQAAKITPSTLSGFQSQSDDQLTAVELDAILRAAREKLDEAKRPVILVGGGIRASGAVDKMLDFVDKYEIPVVTAWNAHDLIWDEHPLYVGRPGTIGDRAGNFAVQNADVLLVLGSRLNIRQIGYAWQSFAREAFKIWVDIDKAELQKPTVRPDMPIHADLLPVLTELTRMPGLKQTPEKLQWRKQCEKWRRDFPVVLPSYNEKHSPINPYVFVQRLFEQLTGEDVVVCADGSACVVTFQAARVKRGQRLYTNSGSASMGYDLPAAIGAVFASAGRVICLAGDGSIQMNLQELQTIRAHDLPIKIFVLNNDGYHSIRQTQKNFFGTLYGCDSASGVTFPNIGKIASAYGFPFFKALSHSELDHTIGEVLSSEGPAVCEIILDPSQLFAPKQSSRRLADGRMVSAPLEDLAPFLERDELKRNMFIPLVSEPGDS